MRNDFLSRDERALLGGREAIDGMSLVLAAAVAAVLRPEFEARALWNYRNTERTLCFLVRPRAWWDALRSTQPRAYERIFLGDDDLPCDFTFERA